MNLFKISTEKAYKIKNIKGRYFSAKMHLKELQLPGVRWELVFLRVQFFRRTGRKATPRSDNTGHMAGDSSLCGTGDISSFRIASAIKKWRRINAASIKTIASVISATNSGPLIFRGSGSEVAMGDESVAGAETLSKSEQKRRQKAEKKAAEKVNSGTSVAVCLSRIRIFPSRIQG